jgi:hypothetical protein
MMKELELESETLVYVTHLTHLPTQEDFNELSDCERQITYSTNS